MEHRLAEVWAVRWQSVQRQEATPKLDSFLSEHSDATLSEKSEVILTDQKFRWGTSHPFRVEDYLQLVPDLQNKPDTILQLVTGEFQSRLSIASQVPIDESAINDFIEDLSTRFSYLGETLRGKLQEIASRSDAGKIAATINSPLSSPLSSPSDPHLATSSHITPFDTPIDRKSSPSKPKNAQRAEDEPFETVVPDPESLALITHIGRYRRMKLLGEGAFGFVWLGLDEELQRYVAIKVPRPERFRGPEDAEQYLSEARTVASLDHPHIIPVYDVGRTTTGSIYVVSKFIEGYTLADRLKQSKLSHAEVTKLIATIAQALHHAHLRRLVHRDVKPANILIEERTGTTYVADFGLAIREEDYLRDNRMAGTPGYMSPEQVRGEGHRIDGRSDIFSLGVIMYEMLTGKRPFRGSTTNELFHQVVSVDPPTPRTIDEAIPVELDRICLKALAKRAVDRYASGVEFADDLSHWQQGPDISYCEQIIVPKGLRSFDAGDADFFLDLLPGTRDRDGLPESVRFWKKRIEETDSEKTFSVGLVYGPSGCGKSSLVKAGLIPRLSKEFDAFYIEATPDETESRILRALHKKIADLPTDLTLTETFTWLRRRSPGGTLPTKGSSTSKIVIILDQFEQWLHSHRTEQDSELVAALRQCDGGQLKAIVMVRDDFAMAAARFMDSLEVPIVQGENFATIDLFDVDHAEQVLVKFGRAFGKLPGNSASLTEDQKSFVSTVASGIARDGKVVSVRLSLFAEMIKGKPWTLQTLSEVGGTEGIGVNFLEETFSSRNANPTNRLHEQAARAVLKALLPEVSTDIKGHMRSHAELLAESGYESRPSDFNTLLRILDGELRLITPTDPEGQSDSSRDTQLANRYYQLTHDYMVPSLRDWLTRKQQETRAGRAALKLAERTNLWTAKPENRYLPSIAEWSAIRALTHRSKWTPPQQAMMRRANRIHGSRLAAAVLTMAVVLTLGLWIKHIGSQQATAKVLVEQLFSADIRNVSHLMDEMKDYRQWVYPLLRDACANELDRRCLYAHIGLLPVDPGRAKYIHSQLLKATPEDVMALRKVLSGNCQNELTMYWETLQSNTSSSLSAGAALAMFAPNDDRWSKVAGLVARLLVNEDSIRVKTWVEGFQPVSQYLIPELFVILRDRTLKFPQRHRNIAGNILLGYSTDNVNNLANLIIEADSTQFEILIDELKTHGNVAKSTLRSLKSLLLKERSLSGEKLASRKENAALALRRLDDNDDTPAKVTPTFCTPAFRITDDPESLTQFVHRCRGSGVSIVDLLEYISVAETNRQSAVGESRRIEDRVIFGLLLALGEFKLEEVPEAIRNATLEKISAWFATDPSSAIHGATGWLLRQWEQTEVVKRVDQTPVAYRPEQEWFTLAIVSGENRFYQTYVVIPPGEYVIRSQVEDRSPRDDEKRRRLVKLTRPVAILDREVVREEFEASGITKSSIEVSPTMEHPMNAVSWYDSVLYCRWLTERAGMSEIDQAYADPKVLDKKTYPLDRDTQNPINLTKRGFRLPTEAEWEIACRAGMKTTFGFGEDESLLDRYGWFLNNSNRQTQIAKKLRPNMQGLFDMHGNLYEWCHDWVFQTTSIVMSRRMDPVGSTTGSYRVYRGGGWNSDAADCQSAFRFTHQPTDRYTSSGMRLALVPFVQEKQVTEPGSVGTEGVAEQRPDSAGVKP